MRTRILMAIGIMLLLAGGVSAEGIFTPPVATVRAAPVSLEYRGGLRIEGAVRTYSIPREAQTQPPCIGGFVTFGNKAVPTQQTDVRLAYDESNLYVVFSGHDPLAWAPSAASQNRDGPVWRDDSVEIFLDPRGDGETYFHLIANVGGARFDSRGQSTDGKSWDGDWGTVPHSVKDGWGLTVVVPFKSLGVECPKLGEVWGANFGRHQVSKGELSTWSPVGVEFNEPWRFGQIVFGSTSSVIASIAPVQVSLPGRRPVTVQVSNPTDQAVSLRAETIVDGKAVRAGVCKTASRESEWKLFVDFPEGKHSVSVNIVDASTNKPIARSAPAFLNIPPKRTRLRAFREIARSLTPPTQELGKEVESLKQSLGQLVAVSPTAHTSVEKWAQFGEKLDGIEKDVARLRYMCADKESRGYVLAPEIALTKVFRDRLFGGEIGAPVKISMAKNEFESAQMLILPHKALEDVSVTVSPLEGPDGAVIPAERIKLELVDYVQTRKPRYEVDYVGWWPDPLLEMKPFDVDAMTIQPVWVTVHTPKDIPGGVYRGRLVVKPSNESEGSLPIEVRVWDFALPTTMHMKTAFALFNHELGAWTGGVTDEIRLRYYEFLLDHRLNPTNIYTAKPIPEIPDLPFCVERGLNAFCLAYTHNRGEEGRKELAEMIRGYETYLKEKGWWDKAYIYGFDEIKPDKYNELRDMYGWVKKEFPDLPRMCTVVPNEQLKGYIDVWVPLTSNLRLKEAAAYTKAGDQVWWYVCCVPPHPFPNFFIDYPAIDPRVVFWMNWKYRIPGFLYYALNNWTTNRAVAGLPEEHRPHLDQKALDAIKAGKRWPEVPWNTFTFDDYNGDGQLIYPGPGGRPFSSIRLESIRDGVEDYEYFYMLDELVKKAVGANPAGAKHLQDGLPHSKTSPANASPLLSKAKEVLAVRSEVVRSPSEYTLDPQVLLHARAEVAELIEKLGMADG